MATFEAQVEGMTGLTIDGSSNPTQTELSTFLTEGAKDVINKMVKVDPVSSKTFANVSSVTSSGTIIDGQIIEAWGSDGTNDREAEQLSAAEGKKAANSDSLSYRTKYNPYFYREGRRVILGPDGGSVLHISFPVVSYDQETIYNFPSQYLNQVVLYGGIRSLENSLAGIDISTFTSSVSAPVMPSLDYSDVDSWINTEEDSEMSTARVQDIGTRIQQYASEVQMYQAKVGQELQEYQQELAEKQLEYQWKSERLMLLRQEYMAFYGTQTPQQKEQPQGRGGR